MYDKSGEKDMLYLIGGASRSGKSSLARLMLKQNHIPYNSLDYITSIFHYGVPELGITHDQSPIERATLIWPRIEYVLTIYAEEEPAYLIEGEAFLPSHIANCLNGLKDTARACFFGYTECDQEEKFRMIRSFPSEANDWTRFKTDDEIRYLIKESIAFSHYIRDECTKYDLAYFDTSHDFVGQIEAARDYLLR